MAPAFMGWVEQLACRCNGYYNCIKINYSLIHHLFTELYFPLMTTL